MSIPADTLTAADVCAILEIVNVGDALSRVDEADIGSTDVWSEANNRHYAQKTVNESGLYSPMPGPRPRSRRSPGVTESVTPSELGLDPQTVLLARPAPETPGRFSRKASPCRCRCDSRQALS